MSRAEHTVVIRRPPDEVFVFLTDPDNLPLWQTTSVECRSLTDGGVEVGTRLLDVRRFLGKRIETTLEIVAMDRPTHSAVRVIDGPIRGEGAYDLREVAGATQVHFSYQADAAGFFRLTEPVITRLMVREFESNLGHLKDLLEARIAVGDVT